MCLNCTRVPVLPNALSACSASVFAGNAGEAYLNVFKTLCRLGFHNSGEVQKGELSFQKAHPHLVYKVTVLVVFLECSLCDNLIFSDPRGRSRLTCSSWYIFRGLEPWQ